MFFFPAAWKTNKQKNIIEHLSGKQTKPNQKKGMGEKRNSSQDFQAKLLWTLWYFPHPDYLLVILVTTRRYKQELGVWADNMPLLQSSQ